MVIGCVVFTLPHFLSRDNQGGSHLQSGHDSLNHHYTVDDRLNQLQNDSYTDYNEEDNYTTYNVSRGGSNDTISSLRQTGADPSKPLPRRAGRNSVCHSAYPQSSRFISGANNRLNLDLEALQSGGGKRKHVIFCNELCHLSNKRQSFNGF